MHTSTTHGPRPVQVAGIAVGLTALLTLLVTAFAWPASQLAPRDLPVAVAGPTELVPRVEDSLTGALGPDALDLVRLESRTAVVQAIEDREVYGGLVLDPDGAEMLTASAASPAVAQLLGQVATRMAGSPQAPPVRVTDVVPTPDEDARGAAFAAGSLPLVLGGIVTAAAVALRTGRRTSQTLAALAVAALAGLSLTAVLQLWLGALQGSYWANASVVATGLAAATLFILGVRNLLGLAGLGLGAALMLLVGNPLSGTTSAPELLPSGWSVLGQWMPPGATTQALRSTAFFDGAAVADPLWILGVWLAAGLAMMTIGRRRTHGLDENTDAAAAPALAR